MATERIPFGYGVGGGACHKALSEWGLVRAECNLAPLALYFHNPEEITDLPPTGKSAEGVFLPNAEFFFPRGGVLRKDGAGRVYRVGRSSRR